MWDLRVANPFGRLSIRNMLMFVAATVATAFAFALLAAPTTHAADATWNGDSIVYEGNQYQKIANAKEGDGLGLPAGSQVYRYITAVDDSRGANAPPQKAHIIYFPPGEDPGKMKSAKYAVYDFEPPDTMKNPSGQATLSLEEKSANDTKTSCTIPGVGWLICPVATFMSDAMDWMYKILAQFLEVQPVQSNTDNTLYKAWSVMRSFANVAFVIAFLLIIYSQVSSIGLSNYGIKKMLPRLVVAAVLVNISYWICALAIDVSNILGYTIEDLFMAITKSIEGTGNNSSISWQNVTATILSGGTLAAVGFVAVGSISGAVYLLLPVLVGILLSALVAIIIMAARQAIIIILVIVAPLAFVAYILPNTEKYFDKWKDLFITMLVLFPIFGVLFGGAQLAGTAIIQNASSLIMVILGMAVKVAPLAIMPFLIKFSGSLLGRIAGMANDPTKGLVDRTRGFANDQVAAKKAKNLSRTDLRRRNVLSRAVQGIDNGRRKREGMVKADEALADARWEGHKNAAKVHEATARAGMMKEGAEARSEHHVETLKRTDDAMQALSHQARSAKYDADSVKKMLDADWEEFEAGNTTKLVNPNNLALRSLARHVEQTSLETAATELRQAAAKRQQTKDTSDALLHNNAYVDGQTILDYAGGIQGVVGQEAALSKGVTALRSQWEEGIKNNQQLMKHFNVTMKQKGELALGGNVTATRDDGSTFTFSGENFHAREAAIDEVMTNGPYSVSDKIILESGKQVKDEVTGEMRQGKTYGYHDTISRLISGKVDKKALYWGSAMIDEIAKGEISGVEGRNRAITYHIENGKIKADNLAGMDPAAVKHMFDLALNPQNAVGVTNQAEFDKNARKIRDTVKDITENKLISARANDKSLEHMHEFLRQTEGWQQPGS